MLGAVGSSRYESLYFVDEVRFVNVFIYELVFI